MIQKKFKLRAAAKRYVLMKIGEGWKSRRGRLYDAQNGDGTMPLQDLIDSPPDGVPPNDWAAFVHYRRGARGQALSQRNTRSRQQQRVNHTAGTKTFAVTYSEMQEKARQENRQTDYGQLFTRTHRHRDGTPTSEAAEEIIARIEKSQADLRASQPPESQGSVDPTAPLKAAVGSVVHPGRVSGMGLGARPSMVYGKASCSDAGTSGSRRPTSEAVDAIIAEKVAAQVAAHRAADEARNKRQQEKYDRWWSRQRQTWDAVSGALIELLPHRRFPSPEPPPPFIYEDSPPPPPPPPPFVDEDPHLRRADADGSPDVTSGRTRGPPETGADHQAPDS